MDVLLLQVFYIPLENQFITDNKSLTLGIDDDE